MATTLEAIIAAVFVDCGANNLDTVHELMARLGFFEHRLFSVTYCYSQIPAFTKKQMMIDLRCLDPD